MTKRRIVRFIRFQVALTALTVVAGIVTYQLLLDDEAKEGLHSLVHTVQDTSQLIADQINNRIGTIMDEDLIEENRAQIRKAWEDLGY